MQLPKKLKVGRYWYSVKKKKKLRRRGGMGTAHYSDKRIEIATHNNVCGTGFKNEEIADTFWHELTHAVLHEMGEKELRNNEKFVTHFAALLTQAVLTAEMR